MRKEKWVSIGLIEPSKNGLTEIMIRKNCRSYSDVITLLVNFYNQYAPQIKERIEDKVKEINTQEMKGGK